MPSSARRALRVASSSALALLTVAGLATAGALVTGAQAHAPAVVHTAGPPAINRPSSSGPIVVAVALGASGTVVSDALAPYEVFASSPQFSVYTVAAAPGPAPTQGGPGIVPTYTFADTTSGRAPRPDVVVVPAVTTPDGPQEAPLRAWVTNQARAGARILGVCNGSAVLAASALLDGRAATAHWSRLGALGKQYPQVNWVAGQRFVQDGRVTTTAGVTSGIPGALHVMAGLGRPDEAARVGRLVGYPDWSLTGPTDIPTQSLTARDLPIGLNALIPWGRPTIGIALDDGDGEIDVASSFEVFDVSYAARPIPLSASGTVVTAHGMVLQTDTVNDDPTPTMLAVPGSGGTAGLDPTLRAWSGRHHVPVDAVHGSGAAPGFDGALEYLASHAGRATAVSAAKMIDYPTTQLRLHDTGGDARIPVLLVLGLALVGGVAGLPGLFRRARRDPPSGT
jgi:putative intracellular protease/amidase